MATIKLSNEAAINAAKERTSLIQEKRLGYEQCMLEDVIEKYHGINKQWVYKRDITGWFKTFEVFAIFGFIGYPFSVLLRLYTLHGKPLTDKPYEMLEWLNTLEDNDFRIYPQYRFESDDYEEEFNVAATIRCMAENNEDDFITVTEKEAKALGIC